MLSYRHRAWLKILFSLKGTFVRGVPSRVLWFGVVGLMAAVFDAYAGESLRAPAGLHETAGAVVAIILTFRSNTAYGRYWESRTLWGQVVNNARNLGQLLSAHVIGPPAEGRRLAALTALFAHLMRRRLRDEDAAAEVARLLPAPDASHVLKAPHQPLAASRLLARGLAGLGMQGRLDPLMVQRADGLLGEMVNALGGCERIRSTPTPLGYVLLMERIVAVYLLTLPFGIVDRAGWLTPVVTLFVAYPMLMLDALAIELDDPFGHDPNDLDLTRICDNLERDLVGIPEIEPVSEEPEFTD